MKTVKLKDICELITRGISPKYTKNGEHGVTILNQKCIRNKALLYEFSKMHNISAKPVNQLKFVKTGDILVNSTGHGTLGRTALAENIFTPTLVDSHVTILRPIEGVIESKYLAYLIGRCENDFIKMATGTSGQTELPRALLSEYEVSYEPSLEKQQKIVAQLDAAFEKIDRAIKLTERNIKNAELLIRKVSTDAYAATDTEITEIGDCISSFITGPFGSALHKSDYIPDGTPVVNPQNIQDGSIRAMHKTMVSGETADRLRRYRLKKGDIVIARRGEMGRCAVVQTGQEGWLCGTGCFVLRLRENYDSEYIAQLLRLDATKKALDEKAVGITMKNLNQSLIASLTFAIPSLKEQQSVVSKNTTAKRKILSAQDLFKTKAEYLKAMKQSLLTQAFSQGEVE